MGLISGVKNLIKNALGTQTLEAQHAGIKEMAKSILIVDTSRHIETFDEALKRLNLTQTDVARRQIGFQRLSRVFGIFGIIMVLYTLYLLIIKSFLPAVGCIGILLIICAQLFRYNFWLYQIQQRRLGCSVKEWFMNVIGKTAKTGKIA